MPGTIAPIHIFRAGRHTAMSGVTLEFTEDHLRASAKAYDPQLHEAPIVVGHPKDDAPAYGWVEGLDYAEGSLQARPAQLDDAFAEMVRKGRFKKVSASFYAPDSPANPKPGAYYLRHVGFLGAQPPSVKGLKQAEFADNAEGVVEIEFSEAADEAAVWGRFKRWLVSQIQSDPEFRETAGSPSIQAPAKPTHEVDDVTKEEMERREAELKAKAEEQKAKDAEFAEREARIAKAEAKARKADITEFVEALVADGKVLPRDKDGLAEFMAGVSSEAVVEFGEGDEAVKEPAGKWLRGFLKNLPEAVDYAERGHRATDEPVRTTDTSMAPGYTADPAKLRKRNQALAYAEKHKVSFVQAVEAIERGAE